MILGNFVSDIGYFYYTLHICLWPSRYTTHTVAASSYRDGKGDIVKEVSEACKRHGLDFGIYLSPWDRNNYLYGQGKPYDDYFVNQ